MKRIISLFLVGVLMMCSLFSLGGCSKYSAKRKTGSPEKKTSLQVHDDGSFRILQITDMHLITKGANRRDRQSMRWLEEAIDLAKPDLIEMSGDITGGGGRGRDGGILAVANYLEEKQIYWAYVFGNHDGEHASDEKGREFWAGKEGKQTLVSDVCSGAKDYDTSKGSLFYGENSKGNEEIYELIKPYEYCLTVRDPLEAEKRDTMGVGNYKLELQNNKGETVFVLVHMDTHGKTYVDPKGNTEGVKGYKDVGYVGLTDDQVSWYRDVIKPYSEQGIKSALFIHVPSYGYRELTEDYEKNNDYGIPQFKEKGDVKNRVDCFKDTSFMKEEGIYAPKWDEGLEAVIDEFPSTTLISAGHDHNNCFFLRKDISDKFKNETETAHEIILAYGRCSGVNAWGRKVDIGATVYDINTNGKTIDEIYEIKEIYPSFPYDEWK